MTVAVAVAGSCGSNSIPSLRTSTCHRCDPKKILKKYKVLQEQRGKEEEVINCPADGGNEQETGKWGERDVSRGFPGEVTADLHNERECDNAEAGGTF